MFGELTDEQYDLMMSHDDPRCKYRKGTRIVKSLEEPKDVHSLGSPGVVMACMWIDKPEPMDCYLIHFDSDAVISFTIGTKLALESEFQMPS